MGQKWNYLEDKCPVTSGATQTLNYIKSTSDLWSSVVVAVCWCEEQEGKISAPYQKILKLQCSWIKKQDNDPASEWLKNEKKESFGLA